MNINKMLHWYIVIAENVCVKRRRINCVGGLASMPALPPPYYTSLTARSIQLDFAIGYLGLPHFPHHYL